MSRTHKDRPYWVKANEAARKGQVSWHDHTETTQTKTVKYKTFFQNRLSRSFPKGETKLINEFENFLKENSDKYVYKKSEAGNTLVYDWTEGNYSSHYTPKRIVFEVWDIKTRKTKTVTCHDPDFGYIKPYSKEAYYACAPDVKNDYGWSCRCCSETTLKDKENKSTYSNIAKQFNSGIPLEDLDY